LVKQKSVSRSNSVELKWKPFLDLIETSRLRRGKVMERQGQVVSFAIQDGLVTATLQGPKLRAEAATHQVVVPCPDWRVDAFPEVAHWLHQRPDWLAALLANQWDDEFWDHLINQGISWYPTESIMPGWQSNCRCTCHDTFMPCTHVVAVVYALLHEMEIDLFAVLRWIGLDDRALLDAVHVLVSAEGQGQKPEGPSKSVEIKDTQVSALYEEWPEEVAVYTIRGTGYGAERAERVRHRIEPTWSEQKRAVWRASYLSHK